MVKLRLSDNDIQDLRSTIMEREEQRTKLTQSLIENGGPSFGGSLLNTTQEVTRSTEKSRDMSGLYKSEFSDSFGGDMQPSTGGRGLFKGLDSHDTFNFQNKDEYGRTALDSSGIKKARKTNSTRNTEKLNDSMQ